jgi:hypothetical protein
VSLSRARTYAAPVARRAVLLGAGMVLGAALALVGGPPPGPIGDEGPPGRSGPLTAVPDRSALTQRCRRLFDGRARAEYLGGEWWCAGRFGGVWRIEPLTPCRSKLRSSLTLAGDS